ncbi:MAG: hypothetical protein IT168_02445 [Bryobacterales bacterium]|nr:hypothetical protein [Bryobacterales bacterium]
MTDEEFYRHALEVLQCELGPDGLARFLRLSRSDGGDYTRDRAEWLKGLSPDDVLQSISANRRREN